MFRLTLTLFGLLFLMNFFTGIGRTQALEYIAFSSSVNNIEDIYIIRTDGSGLTNLTNSPARDYHPTWSPDGTQIAFASNRTDDTEIFVMDNNGQNVRNLTNAPNFEDRAPSWSPDGTKIAFSSNRDGAWDLYTINVQTGAVERITTDTVEKSAPAWFPDSLRIAYWASQDASTAIFSVDTVSKQRSQLTAANGNNWPAIAPDNTRIAFESETSNGKQLFIQPFGENTEAIQVSAIGENVQADWSPDSKQLVYVSVRANDDVNLWIRDLSTGKDKQLTQLDSFALAPAWQPGYAPIEIVEATIATVTPPPDDQNNIDSISLSQSYEIVEGDVDPDLVELLGRSEARLNPAPPYQSRQNDLLRIRVEVEVLPDGSVVVDPNSSDPNNIGVIDMDAFNYMSAEIDGTDIDKFDFSPALNERYMIRLRADQLNFWEWEMRPKPEAFSNPVNYFSVKFYLPERDENGVIIQRRMDGVLRFSINMLDEPAPSVTSTAIPTLGMKLVRDDSTSLSLVVLQESQINKIGVRSIQGEGWLDIDFNHTVSNQVGMCFTYVREGQSASIPAECSDNQTIVIPFGDVFWYDYSQEQLLRLKIIIEDRFQKDCNTDQCEF